MERTEQRWAFIEKCGWRNAACTLLPADASARLYFRLQLDGQSRLLMDSPPLKEHLSSFIKVARHLTALGFSAPRIFAEDLASGFLLLEDFGEGAYSKLLNPGQDEKILYQLAVECLARLHAHSQAQQIDLPPYDFQAIIKEALLLVDWYYACVKGKLVSDKGRNAFIQCYKVLFDSLPMEKKKIVLRDFHVDNLMFLPEREGYKACGLLDFQDALIGSTAYDLVSLLEDARRDVDPEIRDMMKAFYFRRMPSLGCDAVPESFEKLYRFYGVQRHCKVAGIFVRLSLRDGKWRYAKHIPRVIGLLQQGLGAASMAPLQRWFAEYFSDFDQEYDILRLVEDRREKLLTLCEKSQARSFVF